MFYVKLNEPEIFLDCGDPFNDFLVLFPFFPNLSHVVSKVYLS